MYKKFALLALIVSLLPNMFSSTTVQAQSELEVLESSVEAIFPTELKFNLEAQSDTPITDVRIRYTVERSDLTEVTSEAYIDFSPETRIDVEWSWDMRKTGGLPPGTRIDYWWIVKDENGGKIETTPDRIYFEDNRHSWYDLTEEQITIYWYEGSESFSREIMDSAQQALEQLHSNTGAELEKPVRLYIYRNSSDLQGAMIFPQEWTGGVAFTRYSTIAIGISPSNIDWGKRAVTHELTHLVIHQMTLNPYNNLPTWLDEGLAMHTEGVLQPEYVAYLYRAVLEGNLISTRSLSSPFSAFTEQSYLSYAESYSIIDFLITEYGQGKMLRLLLIFKQGSSYDEALEEVYGFDMNTLNELWMKYLTAPEQSTKIIDKNKEPVFATTLSLPVGPVNENRYASHPVQQ
ncbi:peptidase MA family metallohydrolase [Chloroflexota bacterium]